MTELLLLAGAGSLGAVMRYIVSGIAQRSAHTGLPIGTATVNLLGAFVIGLVAGAGTPDATTTVAAVGFLGGFTTMSTWMVETIGLGIAPTPRRAAIVNLLGVSAAGIVLAAAGFLITS